MVLEFGGNMRRTLQTFSSDASAAFKLARAAQGSALQRSCGFLLALALFSAIAMTAHAEEASPEFETVTAYVQALNRGDLQAIEPLVSPNFEIADPEMKCEPSATPRECHLRLLKETVIRNRERRTITAMRQQLEVVRANLTIESEAMKRAGIERILITEEFVVDGDKIRSSRVTLRTEDPQTKRYRDLALDRAHLY